MKKLLVSFLILGVLFFTPVTCNALEIKADKFSVDIENILLIRTINVVSDNYIYLETWDNKTITFTTDDLNTVSSIRETVLKMPKDVSAIDENISDRWLANIAVNTTKERLLFKDALPGKKGVVFGVHYFASGNNWIHAVYIRNGRLYCAEIMNKDSSVGLKDYATKLINDMYPR